MARRLQSDSPPPLTPPHKGEGNSHKGGETPRAVRIAALRQAGPSPRLRRRSRPAFVARRREMQAHLPGPGLACGALNEITAAAHGDKPAAFGFILALTVTALRLRAGPAVLVASQRGARGLRHALRPRARPARPRCRPPAAHRDQERQGRAVGHRGSAALAGPARHGRRRHRRQSRPDHEPPAQPRRRRATPRRSCSCARPRRQARAPRPRAGASPPRLRRAIASAPSRSRAGAWRWSAAATDVPESGLSSGIMSRIVSVWLRAWPIARLLERAGLRRAG